MRRVIAAAAVAVALAGTAVLATSGGGDGDESGDGRDRTSLPTRTVEAGAVTVKMTPVRIDGAGAVFDIVFDTHSVELDLDVAEGAHLVVNGLEWGAPTWTGAGPSGHHREGALRFPSTGAAAGAVELTIEGLPETARATWAVGDGGRLKPRSARAPCRETADRRACP